MGEDMAVIKRLFIFLLAFLLGGAVAAYVVSFVMVSMSVPAIESANVFGPVFLIFGIGSGIFATKKWG